MAFPPVSLENNLPLSTTTDGRIRYDIGTQVIGFGARYEDLMNIDTTKYDISPLPAETYMKMYPELIPDLESANAVYGRLENLAKEIDTYGPTFQVSNGSLGSIINKNQPFTQYLNRDVSFMKPLESRSEKDPFVATQEQMAKYYANGRYKDLNGQWQNWDDSFLHRVGGIYAIKSDPGGESWIQELDRWKPAYGERILSVYGPQAKYGGYFLDPLIGLVNGFVMKTLTGAASFQDIITRLPNYVAQKFDDNDGSTMSPEIAPMFGNSLGGMLYNTLKSFEYRPSEQVENSGFFSSAGFLYNMGQMVGQLAPVFLGGAGAANLATKGLMKGALQKFTTTAGSKLTSAEIRLAMKEGMENTSYRLAYNIDIANRVKVAAKAGSTLVGTSQAIADVYEGAKRAGLDDNDAINVWLLALPAVMATEYVLGAPWVTEGLGQATRKGIGKYVADSMSVLTKEQKIALATKPSFAMKYFAKAVPKAYQAVSKALTADVTGKTARIAQSYARGTVREGLQEGPLEEGWYIATEKIHDKYNSNEGATLGNGMYGTELFSRESFRRVGENMAAGALAGGIVDAVMVGSQRSSDLQSTLVSNLMNEPEKFVKSIAKMYTDSIKRPWMRSLHIFGSSNIGTDGSILNAETIKNAPGYTVNQNGELDQFGLPRNFEVKTAQHQNFVLFATNVLYWQNRISDINTRNPYILQMFEGNSNFLKDAVNSVSQYWDAKKNLEGLSVAPIEGDQAPDAEEHAKTVKSAQEALNQAQERFDYFIKPYYASPSEFEGGWDKTATPEELELAGVDRQVTVLEQDKERVINPMGYSKGLLDTLRNDIMSRLLSEDLIDQGKYRLYTNELHEDLFGKEGKYKDILSRVEEIKAIRQQIIESMKSKEYNSEALLKDLEKAKTEKDIPGLLNLLMKEKAVQFEHLSSPYNNIVDQLIASELEEDREVGENKGDMLLTDQIFNDILRQAEEANAFSPGVQPKNYIELFDRMGEVTAQETVAKLPAVIDVMLRNAASDEEIAAVHNEITSISNLYKAREIKRSRDAVNAKAYSDIEAFNESMNFSEIKATMMVINHLMQTKQPIDAGMSEQLWNAYIGAIMNDSTGQVLQIQKAMQRMNYRYGFNATQIDPKVMFPAKLINSALETIDQISNNGFDAKEALKDKSVVAALKALNYSPDTMSDYGHIDNIEQIKAKSGIISDSIASKDNTVRRGRLLFGVRFLDELIDTEYADPDKESGTDSHIAKAFKQLAELKQTLLDKDGNLIIHDSNQIPDETLRVIEKQLLDVRRAFYNHIVTTYGVTEKEAVEAYRKKAMSIDGPVIMMMQSISALVHSSENGQFTLRNRLLNNNNSLYISEAILEEINKANYLTSEWILDIKSRTGIESDNLIGWHTDNVMYELNMTIMMDPGQVNDILLDAMSKLKDKVPTYQQVEAMRYAIVGLLSKHKLIMFRNPLTTNELDTTSQDGDVYTQPEHSINNDYKAYEVEYNNEPGLRERYYTTSFFHGVTILGYGGAGKTSVIAPLMANVLESAFKGKIHKVLIVAADESNAASLKASFENKANMEVALMRASEFLSQKEHDYSQYDVVLYDEASRLMANKSKPFIDTFAKTNTRFVFMMDGLQPNPNKPALGMIEILPVLDLVPAGIPIRSNHRTSSIYITKALNAIRASINVGGKFGAKQLEYGTLKYTIDRLAGVELAPSEYDVFQTFLQEVVGPNQQGVYLVDRTEEESNAHWEAFITGRGKGMSQSDLNRIKSRFRYVTGDLDREDARPAQGWEFDKVYVPFNFDSGPASDKGVAYNNKIFYAAASRAISYLMLPTNREGSESIAVRNISDVTGSKEMLTDPIFSEQIKNHVANLAVKTGVVVSFPQRGEVKQGPMTIEVTNVTLKGVQYQKGDQIYDLDGNSYTIVKIDAKTGVDGAYEITIQNQDGTKLLSNKAFIIGYTKTKPSQDEAMLFSREMADELYDDITSESGTNDPLYRYHQAGKRFATTGQIPVSLAVIVADQVKKMEPFSEAHVANVATRLAEAIRGRYKGEIRYHTDIELIDGRDGTTKHFTNGVLTFGYIKGSEYEILGVLYYPYLNEQKAIEANSQEAVTTEPVSWDAKKHPGVADYLNKIKELHVIGNSLTTNEHFAVAAATNNGIAVGSFDIKNASVVGANIYVDYNAKQTLQDVVDKMKAKAGSYLDINGRPTKDIQSAAVYQTRGQKNDSGKNMLSDPSKTYTYVMVSLTPENIDSFVPVELTGIRYNSDESKQPVRTALEQLIKDAEAIKSKNNSAKDKLAEFNRLMNSSLPNQVLMYNRWMFVKGNKLDASNDMTKRLMIDRNGRIDIKRSDAVNAGYDKAMDTDIATLKDLVEYVLMNKGYEPIILNSSQLQASKSSSNGMISSIIFNLGDAKIDVARMTTPVTDIHMPKMSINATTSQPSQSSDEDVPMWSKNLSVSDGMAFDMLNIAGEIFDARNEEEASGIGEYLNC